MPKYLLTCHPSQKSRRAASIAVAISLALPAPSFARDASAPPPSPLGLQRLTAFFDNEVATGKLPGAVLMIQQHGRPTYLHCFGVRDVTTGVPMSTDTIFSLHSMTKPITSVAALMLVD